MKKALGLSLFFVVVLASAVPAQEAPSFAGSWETTYGVMTLTQEGNKLKGTYSLDGDESTIEGTVEKNKFTFTYKEATAKGEGWFELAADGKSFAGKWREDGVQEWSDWTGKRPAGVSRGGFDGLWESTYGRMRLVAEGNDIQGSYAYSAGSSVTGKVEGKKLTFTYKEPATAGEGWFELSADGKSFKGKWKENGKANWADWTGKRVEPVAGRVWLVIVEANWEKDLSEPEYNFGSMLRAFFTRAPNVQVRHRFFTDEASLRKWCSEITYIAEPVVISLSTHGSAKGASVNGRNIGGDVLADCLKYASNVKLLHFSACEMMKDQLAVQMCKKLEKDAPFPISGYTTSVDWAASAVIEFMYFDLVLCRNIAPKEAADKLTKLMPFAGDKKVPGAPFPSAGFRIVLPEAKSQSTPLETPTQEK